MKRWLYQVIRIQLKIFYVNFKSSHKIFLVDSYDYLVQPSFHLYEKFEV